MNQHSNVLSDFLKKQFTQPEIKKLKNDFSKSVEKSNYIEINDLNNFNSLYYHYICLDLINNFNSRLMDSKKNLLIKTNEKISVINRNYNNRFSYFSCFKNDSSGYLINEIEFSISPVPFIELNLQTFSNYYFSSIEQKIVMMNNNQFIFQKNQPNREQKYDIAFILENHIGLMSILLNPYNFLQDDLSKVTPHIYSLNF
jgi:hypothetical protein